MAAQCYFSLLFCWSVCISFAEEGIQNLGAVVLIMSFPPFAVAAGNTSIANNIMSNLLASVQSAADSWNGSPFHLDLSWVASLESYLSHYSTVTAQAGHGSLMFMILVLLATLVSISPGFKER